MIKIDSEGAEFCLPCADTLEIEGVIVEREGVCLECERGRGQMPLEKVWGYREGLCAWCLDKKATKEYEGDQPSDMGKAMYQVCTKCYKERV